MNTNTDKQPPKEEKREEEKLRDELRKEKERADQYFRQMQRIQADFENYKKKIEKEREEIRKYATEKLVTKLLDAIDNFERALNSPTKNVESLRHGIQLSFNQLRDVLQKEGLREMKVVGEKFNPEKHEAIMCVNSEEHGEDTVAEEVQKGYMFKDKIIRHSKVKVVKKEVADEQNDRN